jgi:hypothetical protein
MFFVIRLNRTIKSSWECIFLLLNRFLCGQWRSIKLLLNKYYPLGFLWYCGLPGRLNVLVLEIYFLFSQSIAMNNPTWMYRFLSMYAGSAQSLEFLTFNVRSYSQRTIGRSVYLKYSLNVTILPTYVLKQQSWKVKMATFRHGNFVLLFLPLLSKKRAK